MKHRRALIGILIVLGSVDIAAAAPPGAPPARRDMEVVITTSPGRLGVTAIQISPELRTHLGAAADRGVLVDAVRPNGPAARAGLQVGDVVIDVDAAPIRDANDVAEALADRKKGDVATIVVIRNAQELSLTAKLDSDAGMKWRSRTFGTRDGAEGFEQWFQFGDGAKDMRHTFEEMQRRMNELERWFKDPAARDPNRV